MCFGIFVLETSVLHELKPKKVTTNYSKHINEEFKPKQLKTHKTVISRDQVLQQKSVRQS